MESLERVDILPLLLGLVLLEVGIFVLLCWLSLFLSVLCFQS